MSARPGVLRLIAEESKASQGITELAWLLNKVDPIKPKVILEIGVHQGYSLLTWQEAFSPQRMIGIDHEPNDIVEQMIKSKELKSNYIIADSHDPWTLEAVKIYLDDQPVDFLFIDGDHMYDGVKADLEMYGSLVRKGGIIAFDDMCLLDNPGVEVYRYWDEINDNYKTDYLHDDSNGIGVIYV